MPDRIVREDECRKISGLSPSTRLRLEQVGRFPRRRKLALSAIGWLDSELQAWIRERAGLSVDTDTKQDEKRRRLSARQ